MRKVQGNRVNKTRKVFGTLEKKSERKSDRMGGKRGAVHQDHSEFFAALGRRIKQLRKERGWSLHHMVADHGYYQSQWQKYEKGCTVTVDSLLKMAEMFGITLGALIDSLGEFPSTRMETIAQLPDPAVPKKTAAKKPAVKRGSKAT